MSNEIYLRHVEEADLPLFFEQQLDAEANYMAAFTAKDPADREAFDAKWVKILADGSIQIRTILYGKQVAGHIVCHGWFGVPEVSYWLGKEYWGRGIATTALRLFLEVVQERPLYARAVKDNRSSIRVLKKCGFTAYGEDKGFAHSRGQEVEEVLLWLEEEEGKTINI